MLLHDLLQKEKSFGPLAAALQKENKPVLVTGVTGSLKHLFPGALLSETGGKALIVLPEEGEAVQMHKALSSVFSGALFFPERDFSLVRVDSSSRDFSAPRLQVLIRVLTGDFDCVVTTAAALCQATLPPERLQKTKKELTLGQEISKEEILLCLVENGYESTHRVEGAGQFATRGDIIDVFLTGEHLPVRIELFGDQVDCMGYFDPVTQRRVENLTALTIYPAEEICFTKGEMETISQYLEEAKEKAGGVYY